MELEVPKNANLRSERFLACISSNHEIAKKILRKTARLASYYQGKWYVLYVQTSAEEADKIGLAAQRHLINNFKLATEFGAEVIRVKSNEVAQTIFDTAQKHNTAVNTNPENPLPVHGGGPGWGTNLRCSPGLKKGLGNLAISSGALAAFIGSGVRWP